MKFYVFIPLLLLNSCSAFKWNEAKSRAVASAPVQTWVSEDKENFSIMMDEKLHSLHSYYLIGQKNLLIFDSQIAAMDSAKLYQSQAYLNLIAVRTQTEEIEHEIKELWDSLSEDKSTLDLKLALEKKILVYGKDKLSYRSMENLMQKLQITPNPLSDKVLSSKITLEEIEKVYQSVWNSPESAVYEKNIEHLSHMLDLSTESEGKKFAPSAGKIGNITGNEFPAKVWSLTFDDGPGKATSPIILKNLKDKALKATFFQLTQQVNSLSTIAKDIRDSGMEIANHSYSHQQLTKVGATSLEKEITQAVKDQEKALGVKIKFFRLPYGAGVSSQNIREKIAGLDMIHVFWNVDTLDWMAQEPSKIVERTLALMKKTPRDAGVLLFHDIHQRTAIATVQVMDYLKKDGRRVCTLDEIVTQMNEDAETVCPSK